MTFTLGRIPDKFTVPLVNDADYIASLHRTDGIDWPGSLVATLEFPTTPTATIWTADVDGEYLRWNIDVADVQPVYDAKPKKVKLWYVDGAVRLLWATGTVTFS